MGETVMVTGGSRGIGAATARLAAQRGWNVCLSYRNEEQAAATVVADCKDAGVAALAVRADVANEDEVAGLFQRAADELGAPRALVNNAGVVTPQASVANYDAARIEWVMSVNVVGAFICAREAVRRFGDAGGVIVNVSSRSSVLGSPDEYVDYAASKAAVDTMTVGLAREVAARGIRVNAVRPGLIDTEIHSSAGEPERIQRIAPEVPMERAGTADEVANSIVWLLSPQASYITGALLDVGGGR